jgi:hypothetical protein
VPKNRINAHRVKPISVNLRKNLRHNPITKSATGEETQVSSEPDEKALLTGSDPKPYFVKTFGKEISSAASWAPF